MTIDVISDNDLQFTAICVTMEAYLNYAKGGHSDRNGRIPYTGGGSTKAETASRHDSAIAASRKNARLQNSWLLAHQSNGTRKLDEATKEQQQSNRRVDEVSLRGLSVAHRLPIIFQTLSSRRCNATSCSLYDVIQLCATRRSLARGSRRE